MRSTILFGGVGFNTLTFRSAAYAAEQIATKTKTNKTEHGFLVNLHLHFGICSSFPMIGIALIRMATNIALFIWTCNEFWCAPVPCPDAGHVQLLGNPLTPDR
jgi:hypothetical protein